MARHQARYHSRAGHQTVFQGGGRRLAMMAGSTPATLLCADGALQLTDRTKDVIKSGGEWIMGGKRRHRLTPPVPWLGVLGMYHSDGMNARYCSWSQETARTAPPMTLPST
jgi:hypothetical protein